MFFNFIVPAVFLFSCTSPQVEENHTATSLSRYAVGFQLFDLNDSMEIVIADKHFKYSKTDQKNKFVISSSTQLTFLKALNNFEKIIGLFDANVFADSLINSSLQSEKIINFKSSESPDWEALSKNKESIVLGYKHFSLDAKTAGNLQLNIVPVNEYMEEHPLGKAEWIKVFGVLSGKYAQADSVFKEIEARYNTIKATAPQSKVKVLAGEYYDGYWSVPGSSSYVALMIKDAGGEYVVKNISESTVQMNKEAFAQLLKEAEFWRKLTPMDWQAATLTKEKVKTQFDVYPTHLKGILYCDVNKTAYFEEALLHPDWELEDLIKLLKGEKGSHFYRLIKVD